MDDYSEIDPNIPKQMPLLEEFFLDLINNNYSEKTLINYRRDLFVFATFLYVKKIQFDNLGKIEVIKYKEFLRSGEYLKNLRMFLPNKEKQGTSDEDTDVNALSLKEMKKSSPKASKRHTMYSGRLGSRSVNRMLSALRSYFRFLTEADYKVPVPADAIKLIKTERLVSNVAELDELVKLIESPEEFENKRNVRFRNRAMLELLFSTGMRISELINLNREDLKIDQTTKKIFDERIFITGKGKKQRFVYLTDRSKYYLQRYLKIRKDDYSALFIPYRGSRMDSENTYEVRISTNYLQSKIKQYRLRLGINLPTSAHSFRHGFATYLAENGANPAAIQHLLGHESLQTTSRYVHSSDRFAQQSHEKYHPLKS